MPLRGSVQFLLLSLRRHATRRVALGAAVVGLLVAGAIPLKDTLSSLGEGGLTQTLRQSVWQEALADQSRPAHWPWQDVSISMSPAPSATVPRLGLSAAMRLETPEKITPAPVRTAPVKAKMAKSPPVQGDVALSDVTIGDSITFTAADGTTCVYRVTGRRVVDPHLTAREAERFGGDATLFECGPLESLIRQATQGAPEALPAPADAQRKL